MNDSWETDIAALLEELADVQGALLGALTEKRQLLASGNHEGLAAMSVREQALLDRLQACHQRRQELLSRAQAEGLPADSIGSLSRKLPPEGRGRVQASIREATAALAASATPKPHQLGASTAIAVTSLPTDRDYCYRRPA